MCGFIGVFDITGAARDVDRERFMSAVRCLAHRGPDDEACHFGAGVALGFRRLSIVDLQQGRQPLANENDTVWVVQNGDIYNHEELRRMLEAVGHRFRSRSDAEVLVHGYEAWGMEGLLSRLRGMFAFIVWDANRRECYAARDRLGIKPLYQVQHDGRLYLASEIRPLLEATGMDRRVDVEALGLFMRLGFTPGPRTMFAGIEKVPAAHYLAVRAGRCESRCYWRASYAPRKLPGDEAIVRDFRDRLGATVGLHLMSDVPVGALLSGGVDSASIVAHMTRLQQKPVTAVTVGFDVDGYDEKARAVVCARELGLDHVVIDFAGDFMDDYPRLLGALEEPVARSTFAALYHLFGACRQRGFKVVLTGEGSDELLGGYTWHWKPVAGRWWTRSSSLLRAASSGRHPWVEAGVEAMRQAEEAGRMDTASLVHQYFRYLQIGSAGLTSSLLNPDLRWVLATDAVDHHLAPWRAWVDEAGHRDPFQRMLWLQARTRLPDYINLIVDRMSMVHSVEARPPFLDHKLWEHCAPLPRRLKVSGYPPGQEEKYILRQAGRNLVPDVTRLAPKTPLRVPYVEWLVQPRLPEWAEDALSARELGALGLFEPSAVAGLRRDAVADPAGKGTLLMAVLTIQTWAKLFGCNR